MNKKGKTQAAPGWGSADSAVVLVGQSLCHDCMESQKPFTGGCGHLIWASIERARRENHPANVDASWPQANSRPTDSREPVNRFTTVRSRRWQQDRGEGR